MRKIKINGDEVDPESIDLEGIDTRDYPDFADAYISFALFVDGTPLNDKELEFLNDRYADLVNELAHKRY